MSTHPDQQTLRFKEKISEYDDVYTFVFEADKPLAFTAGMYAHVRIPDGEEGNKTREFSIASAPSEKEVRFSMHLWEGSPYKRRIAAFAEGDVVEIFKIKGDFVLPDDETREVILIAGGIGITPVRSMLIESNSRGRKLLPALIHVSGSGFLYENELRALPNEQHRITRETISETLKQASNDHTDADHYVSGPPGFVIHTVEVLKSLGITEERIKTDEFSGYEAVEV